jgi:FAD/FMN-containing dehydrogenase
MTTNVSPARPLRSHPYRPLCHGRHVDQLGREPKRDTRLHRAARNEQEALDAVRFAIREGLPVRAVGSGHSSSPLVQTGGVLMDMSGLSAITGTDRAARRARALAGTTINAFGDALWEQGLALSNQGDIDKQQIAGALATSTHGSGKDLGSFSSKSALGEADQRLRGDRRNRRGPTPRTPGRPGGLGHAGDLPGSRVGC